MKKHRNIVVAALLSFCSAAVLLTAPISAASAEDVFQVMRETGIPASLVQEYRNHLNANVIEHDDNGMIMKGTYRTWDEWITVIREKGANEIYELTAKAMGVSVEDVILLYGDIEKVKDYEPSVQPEKPFSEMTLEEKRAYVNSLPEEERAAFLVTLTPEERSSILRQLDPEQKKEAAASLIELGQEIGMNISVSDTDNLRFDVRDENGRLIDSTGLGLSVDTTGWNTTLPVAGSIAVILLAAGALGFLFRLTAKKEEKNG